MILICFGQVLKKQLTKKTKPLMLSFSHWLENNIKEFINAFFDNFDKYLSDIIEVAKSCETDIIEKN
ncbi:MAG: hypothetical protein HRU38_17915 [Saccharospirillaceae bacterium]|nr:hypothetical protein [Saccharospirillaceae bacterium]